jgi:F-type H+-transporting ATPase subunit beta
MQAAEAFAAEGKDVLLVVDVELATEDVLSFAGLRNGRGAVTVVVFAPQYPEDPDRRLLGCDTTLEFSRRLAATGLYPAIDPVTSSSRLLEEGHVSPRHARAASRLKELVAAGSRLESFMTQPYVVAEDFTKLPGEQVRLDDAIGGVERIADGEAHGLDPKTLLYAGTLEQAMARED